MEHSTHRTQVSESPAVEAVPAAHIRQKAIARLRQTRDTYGPFDGDPQRRTLCGAPAGMQDQSWAETRWASGLAYVTCERCLASRSVVTP